MFLQRAAGAKAWDSYTPNSVDIGYGFTVWICVGPALVGRLIHLAGMPAKLNW